MYQLLLLLLLLLLVFLKKQRNWLTQRSACCRLDGFTFATDDLKVFAKEASGCSILLGKYCSGPAVTAGAEEGSKPVEASAENRAEVLLLLLRKQLQPCGRPAVKGSMCAEMLSEVAAHHISAAAQYRTGKNVLNSGRRL